MMTTTTNQVSRRDVLKLSLGATGLAVLGESIFIGLSFLSPRIGDGEFGAEINAGAVDKFPAGSVTPFSQGRFYLVRLADGGFLALYRRCTHLGCSVPYDSVKGQFVCPCHGSAFSTDGEVLNPPAPRPLDQFPVTITNGNVLVNTSKPVSREPHAQPEIIYP